MNSWCRRGCQRIRSVTDAFLYITDQYHILVIRNHLTKNLGIVFPDIRDEIVQAFDECIHPTASGCPNLTFWSWIWSHYTIAQIGRKSQQLMLWRKLFAGRVTEYLLGFLFVGIISNLVVVMLMISNYEGRNPDWIALNIKFPTVVMKAAFIINMFPNFLKPWVSVCFQVGNWRAILVKDKVLLDVWWNTWTFKSLAAWGI